METKQKTLKDYFNELLELEQVKANQELVDFINGRIDQINKKNSKPRKETDKSYVQEIASQLESDTLYKIAQVESITGIARGKVQYALTNYPELFERVVKGRDIYFKLVEKSAE